MSAIQYRVTQVTVSDACSWLINISILEQFSAILLPAAHELQLNKGVQCSLDRSKWGCRSCGLSLILKSYLEIAWRHEMGSEMEFPKWGMKLTRDRGITSSGCSWGAPLHLQWGCRLKPSHVLPSWYFSKEKPPPPVTPEYQLGFIDLQRTVKHHPDGLTMQPGFTASSRTEKQLCWDGSLGRLLGWAELSCALLPRTTGYHLYPR